MDKKLKAKWVKALRSGKIQQGRGALLDVEGRMCCVGVLGRICGLSDEVLIRNADILSGEEIKPLDVLGETAWKLADMNDGNNHRYKRRRSFKQIANWIDKHI